LINVTILIFNSWNLIAVLLEDGKLLKELIGNREYNIFDSLTILKAKGVWEYKSNALIIHGIKIENAITIGSMLVQIADISWSYRNLGKANSKVYTLYFLLCNFMSIDIGWNLIPSRVPTVH